MKKLLITVLILGVTTLGHATVTLNFGVGVLSNATGSAVVPDNAMFQIIASSDNVFAAPTPAAFIGGNDVLLFSGNFDSTTTGQAGTMGLALSDITLSTGTYLLARWFPTLTGVSASPGYSTSYGEYGSLTDVTWVAPAQGSVVDVLFLTVSAGGAAPDSAGYANLTTAAIPEPSTYAAILGALALGFVAYRRRQRAA